MQRPPVLGREPWGGHGFRPLDPDARVIGVRPHERPKRVTRKVTARKTPARKVARRARR